MSAPADLFLVINPEPSPHAPPTSGLSESPISRPRRRLRFWVTDFRPSPRARPASGLSGYPMSRPPPEARFSSYGPQTITTCKARFRPIRIPYVKTPTGSSVFELRTSDHHHVRGPLQAYQDPLCQDPRRRHSFRVTDLRPSPRTRSASGLSGSPVSRPPPETRLSSYGPQTITTCEARFRPIRIPYVKTPAGGSVIELRTPDHHHVQRLLQAYQDPQCQDPRRRLSFRVMDPGPSTCAPLPHPLP